MSSVQSSSSIVDFIDRLDALERSRLQTDNHLQHTQTFLENLVQDANLSREERERAVTLLQECKEKREQLSQMMGKIKAIKREWLMSS